MQEKCEMNYSVNGWNFKVSHSLRHIEGESKDSTGFKMKYPLDWNILKVIELMQSIAGYSIQGLII